MPECTAWSESLMGLLCHRTTSILAIYWIYDLFVVKYGTFAQFLDIKTVSRSSRLVAFGESGSDVHPGSDIALLVLHHKWNRHGSGSTILRSKR